MSDSGVTGLGSEEEEDEEDYVPSTAPLVSKLPASPKVNPRRLNNAKAAGGRTRPTNNQLLYKAYFRWEHYPHDLPEDLILPDETEACASVTSAFLQVLQTLYLAESRRLYEPRNVLDILSNNTRRTKVVELSSGTHRVPDELKRHYLSDGKGGQYSTNLDRNRYGSDDQYLSTVIRYDLEFLGLCPCTVDVEIIDAKNGGGALIVSAGAEMCACGEEVKKLQMQVERAGEAAANGAGWGSARHTPAVSGEVGPSGRAPHAGPSRGNSGGGGSELFDALLMAATGGTETTRAPSEVGEPPVTSRLHQQHTGVPRARSRLWHTGASTGEVDSLQNALDAFTADDEIASGQHALDGGYRKGVGKRGRVVRRGSISNIVEGSEVLVDRIHGGVPSSTGNLQALASTGNLAGLSRPGSSGNLAGLGQHRGSHVNLAGLPRTSSAANLASLKRDVGSSGDLAGLGGGAAGGMGKTVGSTVNLAGLAKIGSTGNLAALAAEGAQMKDAAGVKAEHSGENGPTTSVRSQEGDTEAARRRQHDAAELEELDDDVPEVANLRRGAGLFRQVRRQSSAANLTRLGRDAELRKLADEIRALKQENRQAEAALEESRSREADATGRSDALRAELDQQRSLVQRHLTQVSALRAEVQRLTVAKREAEARAAAAARARDAAQRQLADLGVSVPEMSPGPGGPAAVAAHPEPHGPSSGPAAGGWAAGVPFGAVALDGFHAEGALTGPYGRDAERPPGASQHAQAQQHPSPATPESAPRPGLPRPATALLEQRPLVAGREGSPVVEAATDDGQAEARAEDDVASALFQLSSPPVSMANRGADDVAAAPNRSPGDLLMPPAKRLQGYGGAAFGPSGGLPAAGGSPDQAVAPA